MNYRIKERNDMHYERIGYTPDPAETVAKLRLLLANAPKIYGSNGVQGQTYRFRNLGKLRARIQQFRNS